MRNFKNMLNIEEGGKLTCAAKTLADAMVEWWMANDHDDAVAQMLQAPGSDLAGIENSVVAGLNKAAQLLGCDPDEFIFEADLTPLAKLSASQIVEVLDAIHIQWINDNFTAKRWAEKFFKEVLGQYRKTAKIPFAEVVKDLLFVQEYLTAAGSTVTTAEIEKAFAEYVATNSLDDDLLNIQSRAHELVPDIIQGILFFREKTEKQLLEATKEAKKQQLQAMIDKIDTFLEAHPDYIEIIELMLEAVAA